MLTAIVLTAFLALLLVLFLCGQFLMERPEREVARTGIALLGNAALFLVLVAIRCTVGINP